MKKKTKNQDILTSVDRYYSTKLAQFGAASPSAVDWNSKRSQMLRFDQLLKVVKNQKSQFSLLDYGCGTGSLCKYLQKNFNFVRYTGYDISPSMIGAAKRRNERINANWLTELPKIPFDFVIASGILNVKLTYSNKLWKKHVVETIHDVNRLSKHGFAFNLLSLYSDRDKRRGHLYYADPSWYFKFCMREFSTKVTLLHDYPLFEFTIIVRK